jgi:hypothetical protein
MTQNEADSLKTCNGMGDIGTGVWLPFRKDGAAYYSPNGLKVWAPYRWRSLTHAQIVAEMDSDGATPLSVQLINDAREAAV